MCNKRCIAKASDQKLQNKKFRPIADLHDMTTSVRTRASKFALECRAFSVLKEPGYQLAHGLLSCKSSHINSKLPFVSMEVRSLKPKLVYTLRPQIIVLRPRHESLTQTLIHHKHHLSRYLCAQERRLLVAHFLPFAKVLRHLRHLYTCGALAVARMRLLLLVEVLQLQLRVKVRLLSARRGKSRVRRCSGGEEEGVY
jgi:hypothetical protein